MQITLAKKEDLNAKQNTLVSGTNIKTINNQSLLGSGNISIPSADVTKSYVDTELAKKQDSLTSGTNIKTINNESILGEGNITIDGISAEDIDENYVPTANGDGTWEWKEQQGGTTTQLIKGEYYSEEEKIIGRWTDGKPIYQKYFSISDAEYINANVWLDTNIPMSTEIENIVFANGYTDQQAYYPIIIGKSTNWFIMHTRDGAGVTFVGFLVKYTKTTDTASTPIPESVLPTSLIKGENYSTEEQCIGRWLDGKPLYKITKCININDESAWTKQNDFTIFSNNTNRPNNFEYIINMDWVITTVNKPSRPIIGYMSTINSPSGIEKHITVKVYYGNVWIEVTDKTSVQDLLEKCYITYTYTKTTDTASTPIQTSLLNSDEIQAMIDASMGTLLGGEG